MYQYFQRKKQIYVLCNRKMQKPAERYYEVKRSVQPKTITLKNSFDFAVYSSQSYKAEPSIDQTSIAGFAATEVHPSNGVKWFKKKKNHTHSNRQAETPAAAVFYWITRCLSS